MRDRDKQMVSESEDNVFGQVSAESVPGISSQGVCVNTHNV